MSWYPPHEAIDHFECREPRVGEFYLAARILDGGKVQVYLEEEERNDNYDRHLVAVFRKEAP